MSDIDFMVAVRVDFCCKVRVFQYYIMTVRVGLSIDRGRVLPKNIQSKFSTCVRGGVAVWGRGGWCIEVNDVGRKTNSEATNSFVLKCGGKEKANFLQYHAWD